MGCKVSRESSDDLPDLGAHIEPIAPPLQDRSSDAYEYERSTESDTMASDDKPVMTALPRGGYVVRTESQGNIQFLIPPETVKDSMLLGLATPEHYVFADRRFDKHHGINMGEFEFPTYFNFFVKRRQIDLICSPAGEKSIRDIFQETLFGPAEIDNDTEFAASMTEDARADLRAELNYFRHNPFNPTELMQIEDLLRFTHFSEDTGIAVVGEVEIHEHEEEWVVFEHGVEIARVPSEPCVDVERAVAAGASAHSSHPIVFDPPTLGVTMLGTSHGFDPHGDTTGMVVWINGRGVVVDPPPYCSVHLKRNHTPAGLIDAIILTHCHADHDSGTFQRIMAETRVVILTTKTIMDSFVRKYAAVTGLPEAFLRTLFTFRPVTIGEPVHFLGGEFTFHYSLHSIPCIGFAVAYAGKSLIFSGDTCNDPDRLRSMYEDGVLGRGRYEQLANFPWHHDLILHEAGVPPIHTPLTTFHPLSDEVKHRLLLVHTANKDVPPECGLEKANAGVEHTYSLDVEEPPNRDAIILMNLLASIDIFQSLPISYASALMHLAMRRTFEESEALVNQGDTGETFFVVASGEVCVEVNGHRLDKLFTTGDYFGEITVFSKDRRTASIVALTSVVIYEFNGDRLFHLLSDAGVIDRLRNVADMRQQHSWGVICKNSVLNSLTASQKTQMQGIFQSRTAVPGEAIWREGDAFTGCILVDRGTVEYTCPRLAAKRPGSSGSRANTPSPVVTAEYGTGALICEILALGSTTTERHATTLIAQGAEAADGDDRDGEVHYYFVDGDDMQAFLARNPRLKVGLWQEYVLQ